MLKMPAPGSVRRRCGSFAAGLLSLGACAAAWAAAQSVPSSQASEPSAPIDRHGSPISMMTAVPEYQLDLKAELVSVKGAARDVKRVALSVCVAPGKQASVRTQPMGLNFTVVPRGGAVVSIDVAMLDARQNPVGAINLLGRLGEPMHAATTGAGKTDNYSIDVTPIAGCPARLAAAPAQAALPPAPPAAALAPLPPTSSSNAGLAPLAPMASNASRHAGVAPVALPPLPSMPRLPPMPSSPVPPALPVPPAPPASTGS